MGAETLERETNSQGTNAITHTPSAKFNPTAVPLNKCMLTELNEVELSKI